MTLRDRRSLARLQNGDVDSELLELDRRFAVFALEIARWRPCVREPPFGLAHVDDERPGLFGKIAGSPARGGSGYVRVREAWRTLTINKWIDTEQTVGELRIQLVEGARSLVAATQAAITSAS